MFLGTNIYNSSDLFENENQKLQLLRRDYEVRSSLENAQNALFKTKNYSLAFLEAKLAESKIGADPANFWRYEKFQSKLFMAMAVSNLTSETDYQTKAKNLYKESLAVPDMYISAYLNGYVSYAYSCLQFNDPSCANGVSTEGISRYENGEKFSDDDIKQSMAYLYSYRATADFTIDKSKIKSDVEKSLSYYKLDSVQKYYTDNFATSSRNKTSTSPIQNVPLVNPPNSIDAAGVSPSYIPATTTSNYITVKYRTTPVNIANPRWEYLDTQGSTLVKGAWYDQANHYMVINLDGTYYHYCSLPSSTWNDFKATSSFGTFYDQNIYQHFDCRIYPVPDYSD